MYIDKNRSSSLFFSFFLVYSTTLFFSIYHLWCPLISRCRFWGLTGHKLLFSRCWSLFSLIRGDHQRKWANIYPSCGRFWLCGNYWHSSLSGALSSVHCQSCDLAVSQCALRIGHHPCFSHDAMHFSMVSRPFSDCLNAPLSHTYSHVPFGEQNGEQLVLQLVALTKWLNGDDLLHQMV